MKILITGGTGLVGSALRKILDETQNETTYLSSKDYDLTNMKNVINVSLNINLKS